MKKVKKQQLKIVIFFSREKSLYIVWACFRNGENETRTKEQQRTQDIFSKDVKLTESFLWFIMFRSFFSLGIVDVGKVRGCSVSGICAYGFIQKLSMIWFQSTIVKGI